MTGHYLLSFPFYQAILLIEAPKKNIHWQWHQTLPSQATLLSPSINIKRNLLLTHVPSKNQPFLLQNPLLISQNSCILIYNTILKIFSFLTSYFKANIPSITV